MVVLSPSIEREDYVFFPNFLRVALHHLPGAASASLAASLSESSTLGFYYGVLVGRFRRRRTHLSRLYLDLVPFLFRRM